MGEVIKIFSFILTVLEVWDNVVCGTMYGIVLGVPEQPDLTLNFKWGIRVKTPQVPSKLDLSVVPHVH